MKLTRFCLLPWRFMQIHAGGMMQCCAVAPDTDEGDFILDYCEQPNKTEDIFDNKGLQMIRHGLLTGNLRPMCRNCFFVPNELITTDEFRKRLLEYLGRRHPGIDFSQKDLTKVHSYNWLAISFTNRCNLSCIYCVQSTMKEKNPYFKMDFPYKYAREVLRLFAEQKPERLSTCVEGEATLYPHWYELFSEYREKYPDVFMAMTTNLNRKFSDEEIDLLSRYNELDISIDSLDPKVYEEMRRGGRLDLLLENTEAVLSRVRATGRKDIMINFHVVLSDKTWEGLSSLADYALDRGIVLAIGNYEVRANSVAAQEHLLKPVSQLPDEKQNEIYKIIQKIKRKYEKKRIRFFLQGDIFTKLEKQVERNYNMFHPYNASCIMNRFYEQYPKGRSNLHLAIVYDADNISHEGIRIGRDETLCLDGISEEYVIVRPIEVYKNGTSSSRYEQTVKLGYKKKILINEGIMEYSPIYNNENIEYIVLEVFDYGI